jgi:HAD superfamily hydrolase (TIGR01509 family)
MLIVNDTVVPCRGLLIDFDGTLVDSESTLLNLWIDMCKERNSLVDADLIRNLVHGRPATKIVGELFPNIDEAEASAILKYLEDKEEVAPYNMMNGACEFIRSANAMGITLGIVTSSWRAKVWNVLNRFDIGHLFSAIVTREDVSKLKPDPEPYVVAQKLVDIDHGLLIALEDSRTGIISAKAAGIHCIGFGPESLREFGADFVASAFSCIRSAPSR